MLRIVDLWIFVAAVAPLRVAVGVHPHRVPVQIRTEPGSKGWDSELRVPGRFGTGSAGCVREAGREEPTGMWRAFISSNSRLESRRVPSRITP